MKLKKLSMALVAAGAFSATGAMAAAHLSYEEGDPPDLLIEEEIMIVLYEAMLSSGGAMVVETSCEELELQGPFDFIAEVNPATDRGLLRLGNDSTNYVWLTAEHYPETNPFLTGRGNQYHLAQGIIGSFDPIAGVVPNSEDGVFYQGGLELAKFNNVSGYPSFKPAFSANSAIFVNNAYMLISPDYPAVLGSVLDEHIIKDFYKLNTVEGKCTSDSGQGPGTDHPKCNPDDAFFDWGLEVITKYDYPEYKFRQDSQHVPWNGGNGWWWIRKRLIADGSDFNFFPTPECHITAEGVYTGTASGNSRSTYTGELTFDQIDP